MKMIEDNKALVEEYLVVFSTILRSANKFLFDSEIEEKSIVVLRMIYARMLAVQKLLDGVKFNYVEEKAEEAIVEPTSLFVLVRNILELFYVYEYVFLLPDSQEKKEFAYWLYMYVGLKERLSFKGNTKIVDEKIRNTTIKANEARQKIEESAYYRGLDIVSKKIIQNRLTKRHAEYRLKFNDNSVEEVGNERACIEVGMSENFFQNTYAYLSTHAHPTYLSLVQFKEAYIGEKPLHDGFAGLAVTFMVTILSLLIDNARKQTLLIKMAYQQLPLETKQKISYYVQMSKWKDNE